MNTRTRLALAAAATLALVTVGGLYTVHAAGKAPHRQSGSGSGDRGLVLDATGQLVYRNIAGNVAGVPVADPTAPPVVSGLRCARFAAAHGTGICLTQPGALGTSDAVVLDAALKPVRRIPLGGIPSRARVSASGRMISWTVFMRGDSYLSSGFSAGTSILDTKTGQLIANIETLALTKDGKQYYSPDVNYWGVTFAADDNRFYASLSTKGKTYLVQGDLANWSARTVRENAECPSLSPDNTRIVFKKRVRASADKPWRLYVLDLESGTETPLAETQSIDDQALWLDNETVAYARSGVGDLDPSQVAGANPAGADPAGTDIGPAAHWDIYSVPADGSGSPQLLVPGGSSPTLLR